MILSSHRNRQTHLAITTQELLLIKNIYGDAKYMVIEYMILHYTK